MIIEPRALRHRPTRPVLPILVLVLVCLSLAGAWVYYRYYMPNPRIAPVPGLDNARLVIGNKLIDTHPVISNGSILLPIETIRAHFDPDIFWDSKAQSVIVTTRDRLVKMKTDSLTAYVNRKPRNLNVSATVKNDVVLVPMDILESLYEVKGRVVQESGTVFFDLLTKPQTTATALKDEVALRLGPSIHEPIVKKMVTGERLIVTKGEEGWYTASTESGYHGFVRERDIAMGPSETPKVVKEEPAPPWRSDGKINLTWEHVVTRNPEVLTLPEMPGVNVVSPTWFGLIDDNGTLKNKADARYVRWAHSRGYKVWALVDNGFDPKRTSAVLKDLEKRETVIRELLAYAALYKIDGINIDFENVYLEDKALFTQFVRELTSLAREQGLVVSIDVTIKSSSPTWSMFYDRKALAQTVDYVMLMAYDEFTSGSSTAGPVGSLPWVEAGLRGVLEEVPPEKLVLGVPFYTRLWREETKNGKFTVTSKALGMEQVEETLRANKAVVQLDPRLQQNFGVFREGNAQFKVWIEDEVSMSARVALVKKYSLAGIASWRRGFEKPSIWPLIHSGLR